MALIQRFSPHFDPTIRKRGEAYFRDGLVELHSVGPDVARATVYGSEAYAVEVWVDKDDGLGGGCDCPYGYEYGDWCKHMWAVLLAWHDALGGGKNAGERRQRKAARRTWRQELEAMHRQAAAARSATVNAGGEDEQRLVYVIDVDETLVGRGLALDVMTCHRKKNGQWSKPMRRSLHGDRVELLPDADDRQIVALLTGARSLYGYAMGVQECAIGPTVERLLVERMCRTGRAFLRIGRDTLTELAWDDGEPWRFTTVAERSGDRVRLVGRLQRADRTAALEDPVLLTAGGLVFMDGVAAALDHGGAFGWIVRLRKGGGAAIEAPAGEAPAMLGHLLAGPLPPPIEAPDDWRPGIAAGEPRARMTIRSRPKTWPGDPDRLLGELAFEYGERTVEAGDAAHGWYDEASHRVIRRDEAFERQAAATLARLGVKSARPAYHEQWPPDARRFDVPIKRLDAIVTELAAAGWHVEAEGKVFRAAVGSVSVRVESGIDWFDVHTDATFDGKPVPMPRLLEALRKGERMVRLDDGTFGLLPEQWLTRFGPLAQMGEVTDGGAIRFRRTQAALLDAMLAAQPGVDVDAAFAKVRRQLAKFDGVKPADPPRSFVGTLRPYQRQGLGWLEFCRVFGFGACLADDMGLGKTIQVLAMLERRRLLRAKANTDDDDRKADDRPPPSLAVVPRSLVHNWLDEAARFTPKLRVLDHTGIARDASCAGFDDHDLVITTYGTLRRDIAALADRRFDYAILDEAQAIKNAATDAAKAARLLRADHRIAMSGTPIENHLGELWSLFEYLNPGMLGRSTAFKSLTGSTTASPEQSADRRQLIAAAVRPFVLRRTKKQVAADLPDRTEQTIECEMDAPQRKLYDELRDHYRAVLLNRIDSQGIGRSKVHVLEALLRLRQAACHPGLIDKKRTAEPSAKLDTLLARLAETADEDHKALVFSQFTSMLAIVRNRLDAAGVTYEYLDGKTRDRAARVNRFQSDPSCKLFLVSLKAGGVGLNLTAADYVFLLDPWWNPAVEQQAIDRAHRIGQSRHVFAYRLITPGTVEQKVLDLQSTKRDLADAIISADKGPLAGLTRDDIARLLA